MRKRKAVRVGPRFPKRSITKTPLAASEPQSLGAGLQSTKSSVYRGMLPLLDGILFQMGLLVASWSLADA